MFSYISLVLALFGSYQCLPDKYLTSPNKTLSAQLNNSMQNHAQENKSQILEKFVRSFPLPSKMYKQNSDHAKQIFLNHPSLFPFQPVPVATPVFAKPSIPALPVPKPFQIQQPTIGIDGQVIIENLLGGVPFNCWGRPSGHYRDNYFCDVFHACVHGYQRKTYSCPFVGEVQYFDEMTQRCEFIRKNPFGCSSKFFYH